MPVRLKLTIAYDGGPFAGWQSQVHRNTIQDHLEDAFRRIVGKKVRVHGAGRTDAGVHALGQCAHADLPDPAGSTAWQSALNAVLPPTIRIVRCRYVSPSFHSRFSAKTKVYRYRIWNGPVLPPFEVGRAWHLKVPLNLSAVARATACFVGRHDFARFAANRGKPDQDTERTILSAKARKIGQLITVEFEGDGFLYKMVRLMVGSISRCALGKITVSDIRSQLRLRTGSNSRLVAPAEGLILVRISY